MEGHFLKVYGGIVGWKDKGRAIGGGEKVRGGKGCGRWRSAG